MHRFLCHIIFCLFLSGNSYAQLSPTGKAEPGTTERFFGADSLNLSSVGSLRPGKDFIISSDTKEIRFQQRGKHIPNTTGGILIAPVKKNNFLSIACNGPDADYPGRIYVCWDDEKFRAGKPDVFLAYSNDSGATWTEPILVTYRPNHKARFMPHMITDRNGYVYLLYYDQQNSRDNKLTDVYLAISKNGGLKFEYYRVNSKAFKFNDRKTILLKNTEPVIVAWTEKKHGLYMVEIRDSVLAAYNAKKADEEIQMERTFIFSDTIKVDFSLKDKSRVSAVITKPLDPNFEKLVSKEKKFAKGKNELLINTKSLGLKKGNYTLILYYNSGNSFCWIMDE